MPRFDSSPECWNSKIVIVTDDFVFIHLQKCAGTFIENLLLKMFPRAQFSRGREKVVKPPRKSVVLKMIAGRKRLQLLEDRIELPFGDVNRILTRTEVDELAELRMTTGSCGRVWFPTTLGQQHDSVADIKPQHRAKPAFGAIRNPWAWWVSWWAFRHNRKLAGHEGRNFAAWYSDLHVDGTFQDFWKCIFLAKHKCTAIRLDLMNELGIGPYTYRFIRLYFRDPEWVWQNWDVDTIKKKIDELMYPIYLCRVEDLRNEMLRFFDSIGLKLTDEQIRILMETEGGGVSLKDSPTTFEINACRSSSTAFSNASEHEPYATYYDDELRNLVAEKERLIVELFGYTL